MHVIQRRHNLLPLLVLLQYTFALLFLLHSQSPLPHIAKIHPLHLRILLTAVVLPTTHLSVWAMFYTLGLSVTDHYLYIKIIFRQFNILILNLALIRSAYQQTTPVVLHSLNKLSALVQNPHMIILIHKLQ